MLQLTFLFLGLVAILATAAAMTTAVDDLTRVMAAVFSMAAWAYWAVSALNVEVAGGTSETYLGLAALGIAAAAIMLLSGALLSYNTIGDAGTYEEVPFDG